VDGLSLSLAAPGQAIPDSMDPALADRIRLLARLALRHRKPVRWRLAATISAAGLVARNISELCREEGLNTIGFLRNRARMDRTDP